MQLLTALLPPWPSVAQVINVQPARFEQVPYTVGTDPTGQADTLTSIALRYGTTMDALAALNPQLTSATLPPGCSSCWPGASNPRSSRCSAPTCRRPCC